MESMDGYELKKNTCKVAAKAGRLDVLKWAYGKKDYGSNDRGIFLDWDYTVAMAAAEGGHLDCLQWAHEHGCGLNEFVLYYAAFEGHLEMVKWLTEVGCPRDNNATEGAAVGGQL